MSILIFISTIVMIIGSILAGTPNLELLELFQIFIDKKFQVYLGIFSILFGILFYVISSGEK